jgi:hypothetical protein
MACVPPRPDVLVPPLVRRPPTEIVVVGPSRDVAGAVAFSTGLGGPLGSAAPCSGRPPDGPYPVSALTVSRPAGAGGGWVATKPPTGWPVCGCSASGGSGPAGTGAVRASLPSALPKGAPQPVQYSAAAPLGWPHFVQKLMFSHPSIRLMRGRPGPVPWVRGRDWAAGVDRGRDPPEPGRRARSPRQALPRRHATAAVAALRSVSADSLRRRAAGNRFRWHLAVRILRGSWPGGEIGRGAGDASRSATPRTARNHGRSPPIPCLAAHTPGSGSDLACPLPPSKVRCALIRRPTPWRTGRTGAPGGAVPREGGGHHQRPLHRTHAV